MEQHSFVHFIWKKTLGRHVAAAIIVAIVLTTGSCSFFKSFEETVDDNNHAIEITALTLSKSALAMQVGTLDYVTVSVKPTGVQKDIKLDWSYDKSVITCDTSSNWGVTITAVGEGQTSLKCSYGGYDAICIITVSGFAETYEQTVEPYIYSNTTVLQTSPGVSEKVFVSLYGGDVSDIDGYTWTADNASVVSIQPTGQYCMITAKDSGYARIKVTHKKAAYPYYIGIYVFADETIVPYITTATNILTLNQDSGAQTVSVALVNGLSSSSDSSFSWQIVDQDSGNCPVGLEYNGNKAVITPLTGGSCTVRITHPDAPYPLELLCRVITIVKNVYIKPDNTVITLTGDAEQTVQCSLENIGDGEYSIDEYSYILDDYNVAEIESTVGNMVMLKGLANGSCKLVISHPKAAYAREVLVIVNGQLTDAIDASFYITTSQNYVRTKVGADPTSLSISLKGGEDGDENGFVWTVKSSAADGVSDVILLETTNSSAVHSRAAASTYAYGSAYITPKAEGTAVITVTHPKIVYPTEILIKVLSVDAILESPLYFTGSGLIRMVNGTSTQYSVELAGKNKTASDDEAIQWSVSDSRITIAASGKIANVQAPVMGTGCTTSYIMVSHNKADVDKKIVVMTADDEETLEQMKVLYSDKLYYNIEAGNEVSCMVNAVGFENDDGTPYDFSRLEWTVNYPSIVSLERNAINPLLCTVQGLKSGVATLTASIDGYTCDFTITVYPIGTVATEPEVYFSTTQNVVSLAVGKTSSVYVSAVNLNAREYSNITWSVENSGIATVVPNGISATITAVSDGETVVSVTHPESQNSLKIYVRVGSEYVIRDAKPVVYISAPDVLTMLNDDSAAKLQAVLVNHDGDTSGFTFTVDNERIATISAQSVNGTAYIKPVGSGQCEVTVSHPATSLTKKVLVAVGNSAEELAGFVYLTTNANVVAIGEGNTRNVSVSVQNAEEIVLDGYTWSSNNLNIVDITPNGAIAVLKANSVGTAIVTVTNTRCRYPLEIIVQCVDPIASAASPYIQLTSSVMNLTVGTTYTPISADLVGGSEADFADFTWSANDSAICAIYGQNEVGKIRALQSGQTYITVSHPKAAYPAQILVVCDDAVSSECLISVPSSIMSMRPTDAAKTVTATLVNGTALDKYNFTWSLDVYDVIDFQYSANVCTITPKQTGSVTITISHPKAAYPQQIIVNVQEYTTFKFPQDSLSFAQGDVQFITMQVPTTAITTHVEYAVDNPAICSISGTKSVSQLTAIGCGTTTVRAKLIASSSGVEQASCEMLVYVKEKAVDAVYITASSTIYTINKGKSQSLSATLSGAGITTSDTYNLKWSTNDTDIVQITGITADGTVTGQSIYVTAVKPGEALITCTHAKVASALQFYVVVPGEAAKTVTLNKSYMTILKDAAAVPLTATIENSESSNDYYNLEWAATGVNGAKPVRIMGSGQTVLIYPLAVGEATITVQLPDSASVAKCSVVVEAGKSFSFETTTRKIHPFESKVVKYSVSPANAILTWTTSQDDDYFEFNDLGCDSAGNGSVEITGIKEGSGSLIAVTDGGAKATLKVRCAWDYSFSLDKTKITAAPDATVRVNYRVSPAAAKITMDDISAIADVSVGAPDADGNGVITITPTAEGAITTTVTAKNTANGATIGSSPLTLSFAYSSISIVPTLISKTGNFSYYDGTSIHIGDGEAVTLKFSATPAKANVSNITVTCNAANGVKNLIAHSVLAGTSDTHIFTHTDDHKEYQYRITEGYVPIYYETWIRAPTAVSNPRILNPADFEWRADYDLHGDDRDDYLGLFHPDYSKALGEDNKLMTSNSKSQWADWWDDEGNHRQHVTFSRQRDTSLDGKVYTKAAFESIPWYYCPGISNYGTGAKVSVSPQIMTNNIHAVLETSTDATLLSSAVTNVVTVEYLHNGKTERRTFQIITDTRGCLCTQQ